MDAAQDVCTGLPDQNHSAGGRVNGLKNVSHHHDDALSRIGWDELEHLLASYYREVGWWVEHAGTGGTGAKFDGGVDLRIRRDAEVVLVQCKHWNAKQVPHNAVHELIGVMVNEGATGAILVSSGEFTRAAIEAANRQGRVKLIDGYALRAMLGPLPEPEDSGLSAPVPIPVPGFRASSAPPRANLLRWSLALICGVAFLLIVRAILVRTADTAIEPPRDAAPAQTVQPTIVVYEPGPAIDTSAVAPQSVAPRQPTEAEIRESQRKADEAMKLIEHDTPAL
jgi:restriction system protein